MHNMKLRGSEINSCFVMKHSRLPAMDLRIMPAMEILGMKFLREFEIPRNLQNFCCFMLYAMSNYFISDTSSYKIQHVCRISYTYIIILLLVHKYI